MREASPFDERLTLLVESEQITRTARALTEQVVADVEAALGLRLDEDNGAQFVTHLGVALTRVERGADDLEPSAVVEDEIRDRPRERAIMEQSLARCGERLGRSLPPAEIAYMTVHLCAVVEA